MVWQMELEEKIAALAAAYTPEWRFDREHPDAGTALALLFAELFSGTLERFDKISEKHRYAFFDMLGLTAQPAWAAGGYVTFELSSDEFGGVFLPRGISVSGAAGPKASGNAAAEHIRYKTRDALYVTPARLTRVIFADGERDYIGEKDFTKPFLPFAKEEPNLQEHAFYLCGDEVLDVSGQAEIRVTFRLPKPVNLSEVMGISGGSGLSETGGLLNAQETAGWSFSYGTAAGFEEYAAGRTEGDTLILRRESRQPKPAEREHFGRRGHWLCCRYRGPWTGEPFAAEEILLASRRDEMEPDILWNEDGQQENEKMLPFGENPAPYGACYFASAEALGKAGAQITVTFRLDYERVPFDNSCSQPRQWKMLMKRADFIPDPEYDITVEQVVWEYYNGAGWARLPLPEEWETLFSGSGKRAGRQVCISFSCPPDAALLEWQTAPTRYLRVRILRMKNLYEIKGAYIVPVISGVRFGFDYGEAEKKPYLTAACNNREQKVYSMKEPEQTQVLLRRQRERRSSLYLGFHRPLSEGPLRILFSTEEEIDAKLPCLAFSYSGKHGFVPLSAVDETENLKRSGTVTFMGSEDSAARNVCGETAYWICITGEQGTWRAAPRINGIFLNAVRVSADEGQLGEIGGAAGNQPPGGVTRIDGSYGYVSGVTNPLPIAGGCDAESAADALRRGSAALCHGGRAVTASDFEALTREASRAVKKVRCYSGRNARGAYEPGAVTLVLLLGEFKDGSMYFGEVREQVREYLLCRTGGNTADLGRLYVTEPMFLELDCEAEVVVRDTDRIFEVREEIMRVTGAFLDPLTGNYDGGGWEIGVIPNETQVINAVKAIPGLFQIERLRLLAYRRREGRRVYVPLGERAQGGFGCAKDMGLRLFAVPLPGKCRITVNTE